MSSHIDPMDSAKDQTVEYAVYLNDRQRQPRAAQQHDEDQYAAAVDEGTYGGTYSQWRGEN